MPATPPPIVTVAEPIQREVTDYQEYTGQTASVDSVQVRARVSGYLDKIHFKDGADIKEGEVLYEIDPRPYKAALDQAEAQIKLQEAQAKYQGVGLQPRFEADWHGGGYPGGVAKRPGGTRQRPRCGERSQGERGGDANA